MSRNWIWLFPSNNAARRVPTCGGKKYITIKNNLIFVAILFAISIFILNFATQYVLWRRNNK